MFSGMKNKEHESMHGPRTFHLDGGGGQRDPGDVSLYRILQRAVLNSFDKPLDPSVKLFLEGIRTSICF